MNIIEQQELLKDLSDQDIAGEMQQPSGNVPLYLVAGEAKRRADLRQRFKAEQSGPPPTSTVQEDLLSNIMASQMPATGIAQGMPQRMAQVGGPPLDPNMPAPNPNMPAVAPNPNMPAIAPTGEAPVDQIAQAQGIMAGQQGDMVRRLAGGGLVREDRKYFRGSGVYAPRGGAQAYADYWNLDAPRRKGMAVPEIGAPRRISAIEAKRRRDAEIQAQGLEDEALDWQYKDISDFSMVDPTYDPMITSIDPVDGGMTTSRYSDRRINQAPPIDTSPLTVDPRFIDPSMVGGGPPEPNFRQELETPSDMERMVAGTYVKPPLATLGEGSPLTLTDTRPYSADTPRTPDEITRASRFIKNKDLEKKIMKGITNQKEITRGTPIRKFMETERSNVQVPNVYAPKDIKPTDINARETMDAAKTKLLKGGSALDKLREGEIARLTKASTDRYGPIAERLAERRAALAEDREGNLGETLLRLGSGIMAGKSQYAGVNIGEAGQDTLKFIQDRKANQAGREDALLASDMGVVSGRMAQDAEIRQRAGDIVADTKAKLTLDNAKIRDKNIQINEDWERNRTAKDNKYTDAMAIADKADLFKRYNNTQKIQVERDKRLAAIEERRYDQNLLRQKALDNNTQLTREERLLSEKFENEIRIAQLDLKALETQQNRIDRKTEQVDTRDFRKELLGKTQDFQAGQNKLNRQAKKDAPAPLIKAFNQANDLPEGTPKEKAFKERIFGAIDGSTKAKRSAIASATKSFNDKYTKWVQERGTPRNAAEWKEAEEGLGLDSVSQALLALQKQRVMGGSGGPANNATGRGKPAYRQVK